MPKQSPPKRRSRIANAQVAEVFANYPAKVRERLLSLRQLILDTASETPGVGKLDETLKWNEPAYVTTESKSGSTIRINKLPSKLSSSDSKYAIFFNCNTSLVDTFRTLFPDTFKYAGNRAIEFDIADKIPAKELQICISIALTYHRTKK